MDNTRLYTTDQAYQERYPTEASRALVELFRVLRPGGRLWFTVPVGKPSDLGWLQIFEPSALEAIVYASAFTIAGTW